VQTHRESQSSSSFQVHVTVSSGRTDSSVCGWGKGLSGEDPIRIKCERPLAPLQGVRLFYITVPYQDKVVRDSEEAKLDKLCDLYETLMNLVANNGEGTPHWQPQTIMWCCNTHKVEWLEKKLIERFKKNVDTRTAFDVSIMRATSAQTPLQRQQVLRQWSCGSRRSGGKLQSTLLISTDPFARIIDVEKASLVINYDPVVSAESTDNYMYRVGRARGPAFGRFIGASCVSINFMTPEIRSHYEDYFETQMHEVATPEHFEQIAVILQNVKICAKNLWSSRR
jgi:ATP-dependent RNA helicase